MEFMNMLFLNDKPVKVKDFLQAFPIGIDADIYLYVGLNKKSPAVKGKFAKVLKSTYAECTLMSFKLTFDYGCTPVIRIYC